MLPTRGGPYPSAHIAARRGLPAGARGSAHDPGLLAARLTGVMDETATRMEAHHEAALAEAQHLKQPMIK